MSEPIVWCETCNRTRNPYLHVRSQRVPPPTAAKNWLRKNCPITYVEGHAPCALKYQAGLGFTAPRGMA